MRRASNVLIAARLAAAPGDPHLPPLLDAGFELVWNPAGRFLTEDELVAPRPGGFFVRWRRSSLIRSACLPERPSWASSPVSAWDTTRSMRHPRRGAVWPTAMAFGANHEAAADYALGLALADGVRVHHQQVRDGKWQMDFPPGFLGVDRRDRGTGADRQGRGEEMRRLRNGGSGHRSRSRP